MGWDFEKLSTLKNELKKEGSLHHPQLYVKTANEIITFP
jgi:hypothetical protein